MFVLNIILKDIIIVSFNTLIFFILKILLEDYLLFLSLWLLVSVVQSLISF